MPALTGDRDPGRAAAPPGGRGGGAGTRRGGSGGGRGRAGKAAAPMLVAWEAQTDRAQLTVSELLYMSAASG